DGRRRSAGTAAGTAGQSLPPSAQQKRGSAKKMRPRAGLRALEDEVAIGGGRAFYPPHGARSGGNKKKCACCLCASARRNSTHRPFGRCANARRTSRDARTGCAAAEEDPALRGRASAPAPPARSASQIPVAKDA